MTRAVRRWRRPAIALIDGKDAPPLACACETLIGGDGLSVSIAAASIIAKVTRDRMMTELHAAHPDYGWDRNMGYGTAIHLAALNRLGPSPITVDPLRPYTRCCGCESGGVKSVSFLSHT